jgi:hypothetical protein
VPTITLGPTFIQRDEILKKEKLLEKTVIALDSHIY